MCLSKKRLCAKWARKGAKLKPDGNQLHKNCYLLALSKNHHILMLPLPRFKLKRMSGFTEGPAFNLGDEKKYCSCCLKLLWFIKEHVWKLYRAMFPQCCIFSTTTNSFEPNKVFFPTSYCTCFSKEKTVWFVRCDVWRKIKLNTTFQQNILSFSIKLCENIICVN